MDSSDEDDSDDMFADCFENDQSRYVDEAKQYQFFGF